MYKRQVHGKSVLPKLCCFQNTYDTNEGSLSLCANWLQSGETIRCEMAELLQKLWDNFFLFTPHLVLRNVIYMDILNKVRVQNAVSSHCTHTHTTQWRECPRFLHMMFSLSNPPKIGCPPISKYINTEKQRFDWSTWSQKTLGYMILTFFTVFLKRSPVCLLKKTLNFFIFSHVFA